jgi:hypothetical protein
MVQKRRAGDYLAREKMNSIENINTLPRLFWLRQNIWWPEMPAPQILSALDAQKRPRARRHCFNLTELGGVCAFLPRFSRANISRQECKFRHMLYAKTFLPSWSKTARKNMVAVGARPK